MVTSRAEGELQLVRVRSSFVSSKFGRGVEALLGGLVVAAW